MITRSGHRSLNRSLIESAIQSDTIVGLKFVYVDLPSWVRLFRWSKTSAQFYYYLWQVRAYFVARRLCREIEFDLTHHVTLVKYWAPSFLSLLNPALVWGPVGGGESTPRGFWRDYSLRGRLYECLRSIARWIGERDPLVRLTARRSAVALATTEETAARLHALQAPNISVHPAIALSRQEFRRFDDVGRINGASCTAVRFISIGRLIHWKGLHLGIRAFAQASIPGAEYWLVGDGSERPCLEALAQRLGVFGSVKFLGRLSRTDTLQRLGEADVLVHPSLHDSGGLACLEAMAGRHAVICLDLGGPAQLVTNEVGIKIPARTPEQVIADIADAMIRLAENPNIRRQMGSAGRSRVSRYYLWDLNGLSYCQIYLEAIKLGSESNH